MDLQNEWRPVAFSWKRVPRCPNPSDIWCACIGPAGSPDPSLGLCPCEWPVQVMVEGDAYEPFPDPPAYRHVELVQAVA